jgi:hypothetical protein
MTFPRIRIGRPQLLAALMLLFLFAESLWVIHRQQLTQQDYDFARCGRQMWEKPSPLTGYFTTCGNIPDGTLAYRVAGFPLTIQRILSGAQPSTTTWELRHQIRYVLLLEHLPFTFFALWLGGGIWWVSRRLFSDAGGYIALAFYCLSPSVVHAATIPNNEILAAWGLYGIIYTAIGVAHAMYGPSRKWRPRIILLAVALGLTAAAHIAAAIFGLILALILMLYLAERRRGAVIQVLALDVIGAIIILFASYAFSFDAFTYLLRGPAARIWLSLDPARIALINFQNAGFLIAIAVALIFFFSIRRARYFGNFVPLFISCILVPLITTGVFSLPWLWSLPFLFTFLGGVFSDVLETRHRRLFTAVVLVLLVLQSVLTGFWLFA